MSEHVYDVGSQTVQELFSQDTVSFEIPQFQRLYAWGREEVSALVADLLEDSWRTGEDNYFLGSIVLARQGQGKPHIVLDGQQRLVTLALLLADLCRRLQKRGHDEVSSIRKLLEAGGFGKKKFPKIRLQSEDAGDFAALVDDAPDYEIAKKAKRVPLAAAMQTIRVALDELLDEAADVGGDLDKRLEDMVAGVIYHVEIVRILAPNEASAFRLFETLNDRGLPLNAADLIKNKLLAQSREYLDEVRDAWSEIANSVGTKDVLVFLRHYWIAFMGPVRKDRLYDAFKTKLQKAEPQTTKRLAITFQKQAAQYAKLLRPTDTEWDVDAVDALCRLVDYRARSCRPLLLLVADVNPAALTDIVAMCESAIVRTMIGGRNPNLLEKAYIKLCDVIRSEPSRATIEVSRALGKIIPNDLDFETEFGM